MLCHIVQNALLHTAFSVILPAGNVNEKEAEEEDKIDRKLFFVEYRGQVKSKKKICKAT